MKQYVIDQLRPADFEAVKTYLDENCSPSSVEGIYWIELGPNLLTEVQKKHSECQPFYFAVDLEQDHMACELLVRSQNRLRCNCIGYATEEQRNWIVRFADDMFDTLGIKI